MIASLRRSHRATRCIALSSNHPQLYVCGSCTGRNPENTAVNKTFRSARGRTKYVLCFAQAHFPPHHPPVSPPSSPSSIVTLLQSKRETIFQYLHRQPLLTLAHRCFSRRAVLRCLLCESVGQKTRATDGHSSFVSHQAMPYSLPPKTKTSVEYPAGDHAFNQHIQMHGMFGNRDACLKPLRSSIGLGTRDCETVSKSSPCRGVHKSSKEKD